MAENALNAARFWFMIVNSGYQVVKTPRFLLTIHGVIKLDYIFMIAMVHDDEISEPFLENSVIIEERLRIVDKGL